MKAYWAVLILLLAGIAAYGNTLKNSLFWDDDEFITRNEFIRSFKYWPEWLTKPTTAGAGVNSNYYRPLLTASFALDYKAWKLWPGGYHGENLLWHAAAAILLFVFLIELLPRIFNFQFSIFKQIPKTKQIIIKNEKLKITAFTTAMLWLVHPVHVEAVAYANSRGDSMAVVFILLTLIFWLKEKYRSSAIMFILALLSKEYAMVTPGLILLIELIKNSKLEIRNSKQSNTIKLKSKKTFKIGVLVSIAIIYLILRLTVLNFQNTLNFYGVDLANVDRSDPLALYATNTGTRILTFLKVLPIYAQILIWPKDLHMERTVTISTIMGEPIVIMTLAILMAIWLYGYMVIRKKKMVFPFAIGWFFVSIFPMSGIIPISQILAEHFLYLPSIGIFILIGWIIVFISQKFEISDPSNYLNVLKHFINPTTAYWVILIILFVPLMIKTIRQNRIWHDPITFYEYTLTHTQPTIRVLNNLGMAYAEAGKPDKAIENYGKAIGFSDVYPNPHYNMGNTFEELGKLKEAEEEYKWALEIDSNFYYARLKLGQIYLDQGKIEEAKKLVCPVFPNQPLCQPSKTPVR